VTTSGRAKALTSDAGRCGACVKAGKRFSRRIPRSVVFLGLFLTTAAIAIIVILPTGGAPTPGATVSQDWVQIRWGPVGPVDRDLLVRVRLAGLWEIPAYYARRTERSSRWSPGVRVGARNERVRTFA
jgi:hypothetical protein